LDQIDSQILMYFYPSNCPKLPKNRHFERIWFRRW